MSGNPVFTVVTLAFGENGAKIAYFSRSACTVHSAAPLGRGIMWVK